MQILLRKKIKVNFYVICIEMGEISVFSMGF